MQKRILKKCTSSIKILINQVQYYIFFNKYSYFCPALYPLIFEI